MSEPILQIRHLSKSFGTNQVLRDIDFNVAPGDVTSIIGASGSGKSTLLRCINLLETPTSGEILFHGKNMADRGVKAPDYRAKVGMVFQSFNLFNNREEIPRSGRHDAVLKRPPAPDLRRPETARRHRPRAGHAAGGAAV